MTYGDPSIAGASQAANSSSVEEPVAANEKRDSNVSCIAVDLAPLPFVAFEQLSHTKGKAAVWERKRRRLGAAAANRQ